ncbi:hypothetical protein N303_10939, partial [Cuculus canorus]
AAVDFLLLGHGHECEEFEGMCCMNLSDYSRPIHKSISILMDRTQKLEMDDSFF